MQIICNTDLGGDAYFRQKAWEKASLDTCPAHPEGGCGLARHGYYKRHYRYEGRNVVVLIPRWYCRQARRTWSSLPVYFAARMTGTLDEREAVAVAVETEGNMTQVGRMARRDVSRTGNRGNLQGNRIELTLRCHAIRNTVLARWVYAVSVSGQTGTSRLAVDDQHLFSDHLNSVNPVTTDGDKAHGERHFTITTHPTARSCAEP